MSDNPYALRFDIWQEAKQTLAERFYNNYEVWTNWMNPDFNMIGECPIKEKPNYPTADDIRVEANKIYDFVQTKS